MVLGGFFLSWLWFCFGGVSFGYWSPNDGSHGRALQEDKDNMAVVDDYVMGLID
jgi:hypothetical protein